MLSPNTNRLIDQKSPYLLQHAHNPVDWFPWSQEAFDKARKEQKLILVSIGYATCHWCHVMERESFEDIETAAFLNKNFISIRKAKDSDWDDLTKELLATLNQEITEDFKPLVFKEESQFDDDISKRIEEVLNEKIRPAVAMDGGDIRLKSYKDGVAEVLLKGACAGCPSSTVTLKHGVERMIKHYVPEVNSVEAFNINE